VRPRSGQESGKDGSKPSEKGLVPIADKPTTSSDNQPTSPFNEPGCSRNPHLAPPSAALLQPGMGTPDALLTNQPQQSGAGAKM
jgi:hypothetical protein